MQANSNSAGTNSVYSRRRRLWRLWLFGLMFLVFVFVWLSVKHTVNSNRALPRFTLTYPVKTIAISADGQVLAAGEGHVSAQIRLWDFKTGRLLHEIKTGHNAAVWSLAFSPDGKTVVTTGRDDGRLLLWDVRTGNKVGQLTGVLSLSNSLVFSPKGKFLVNASRGIMEIWDVQAGRVIRRLKATKAGDLFAAMMPDGKTLLTTGVGGTNLWDLATGKLRRHLQTDVGQREHIKAALSPNGKMLALGTRSKPGHTEIIEVWDLQSNKLLYRLRENSGGIDSSWNFGLKALIFSPDSRMVANSSANQGVKLRDARTGVLLSEQPDIPADSIAFLPGSNQLALAYGREIRLWEFKEPYAH